jgi:hypothetical protein
VPNYSSFRKQNRSGWTILPSGNQKRFWRDPVKRVERFDAFLSRVA